MTLVVDLKDALSDGRVTIDEVVATVSDGKIKESLRKGMEGLDNIPKELTNLNPWDGIRLAQKVMSKLGELLSRNT